MKKDRKLLIDSIKFFENIINNLKQEKNKLENKRERTPKIFRKNIDKKIICLNKKINYYNEIYLKECKYFYDFNK